MGLMNDDKVGTLPRDEFGTELPLDRAGATSGLRSRILAIGTIQVTGGAAGTDTFDPQVNSVSLVSAPVAWTTSHNATATAIATAINANAANHNYVATVATDTVTVRQRTSGAITGALATVVTNSATTTDTDFSADTDTWSTFHSGDTFDGDAYHELSWSNVLALDNDDLNPDNAGVAGGAMIRALVIQTASGGSTVKYWTGGLQAVSNVITGGRNVAANTEKTIPWLGASTPLIVKLSADGVLDYEGRYI